jgi:hypothetical protein
MDPAISYILTVACLIGLTTRTMFLVLYERSLSRQAKLLEEMGSIVATRPERGVSEIIGDVPLRRMRDLTSATQRHAARRLGNNWWRPAAPGPLPRIERCWLVTRGSRAAGCHQFAESA